jgi:hypothetical protein
MPYKIEVDPSGRFAIEFAGEPAFIRGFRMSPERAEPESMDGQWLLLTFAIWNSHDRPAIEEAIRVAKQFEGRFRLGVRPFEGAEELAEWLLIEPDFSTSRVTHQKLPSIDSGDRTPFWHWLSDGKVISRFSGHFDPGRLASFAENCLSTQS